MLQVCFGVQDCLCSEHLLVAFPNLLYLVPSYLRRYISLIYRNGVK